MIRYADLFCGLGAFHQAFKSNPDFKCVAACDINDKVREIYKANHGLEPFGDIKKIDAGSLPDLDLVCAGFPCQPFSIAGLQKGFEDANGNLFYDILRIVDSKSPRMVILENVKNLKGHDGGKTFSTIKSSMEERGYKFDAKVLDASHYGSPQCRQRIFMVAYKGGSFSFPSKSKAPVSVSSILDPNDISNWNDDKYFLVEKDSKIRPFKPRILFDICLKSNKKGGRQGERIYDAEACGVTVCAQSGGPGAKTGLYKIGQNIRRLNPGECLKMFGFPDSYDFLDAPNEQRMFFLGNSIVVNVVEALVPEILKNFNSASI
jgi:DNA (cytosine-5)-methyltransferase 1